MKPLLFFVLSFAVASTGCKAQYVTLKSATVQSWSGGIAGRHGYNYYLELVTQENLKIDSIYLSGYCYALKNSNRADDGQFWYKVNENTYRIVVKQSFNQDIDHIRPVDPNEEKVSPEKSSAKCTPQFYEGKALLIYHRNNKRETLVIKEFTSIPGARYP